MAEVERRLGRRPRFGALDAAFDAAYIHDYFAEAGGFAAVPFTEKGKTQRTFDEAGLPLCPAGLAMPCTSTFMNYRGLVPQRQGHYGCPLLHPELSDQTCPIQHPRWPEGGCVTTMGVSAGARLRYLLNRDSAEYEWLYAAHLRQRITLWPLNSGWSDPNCATSAPSPISIPSPTSCSICAVIIA
jgi:hypothetical protein